jgi:hypothetical protein
LGRRSRHPADGEAFALPAHRSPAYRPHLWLVVAEAPCTPAAREGPCQGNRGSGATPSRTPALRETELSPGSRRGSCDGRDPFVSQARARAAASLTGESMIRPMHITLAGRPQRQSAFGSSVGPRLAGTP